MKISTIVICKNQGWNIARLIESVLRETQAFPGSEVLLLDSASSDATITIAQRYPIGVYRFPPGPHLNPNIGRYVGHVLSQGDCLFFLDGDMELAQGWLAAAVALLEQHPEIAAISGHTIDVPKDSDTHFTLHAPPDGREGRFDVPFFGGAALYRRAALEEIGTFNPWLKSEGEPELCNRLRHHGYRLQKIDFPVVYHYSDPTNKISTMLGRRKRSLYYGFGQNLRNKWGTPDFWPYFKERGYGLAPGLGLLAGVAALLISLISGNWIWMGAWLLAGGLTLLGLLVYKRSLYQVAYTLVQRSVVLEGTLRGLLIAPRDPASFSIRPETVQEPPSTPLSVSDAAGDDGRFYGSAFNKAVRV